MIWLRVKLEGHKIDFFCWHGKIWFVQSYYWEWISEIWAEKLLKLGPLVNSALGWNTRWPIPTRPSNTPTSTLVAQSRCLCGTLDFSWNPRILPLPVRENGKFCFVSRIFSSVFCPFVSEKTKNKKEKGKLKILNLLLTLLWF